DARRVLPSYAPQRFERWFEHRERPPQVGSASANSASAGNLKAPAEAPAGRSLGRVALFADTWTRFNEQGPGKAAVRVLDALGYDVELVAYGCCARPQISKGMLRDAKKMAAANVAKLKAYVDAGVPVVGIEPSCIAAFTDDYPDLVPGEDSRAVAGNVRMVEDFLAKEWTAGRFKPEEHFERATEPILFHAHCQQKAVLGASYSAAVLGWVADDVEVLDAGCCGMAGSFGYGHHELSMTIGER